MKSACKATMNADHTEVQPLCSQSVLRKLATDPRVIGSATACMCLYLDALPGGSYGTFRDPVGDVLFSILFAQLTALANVRRWDRTTGLIWIFFLLAKLGKPPLILSPNALLIEAILVFGAHCIVGGLVKRQLQIARWDAMLMAAFSGCACAFLVSWPVYLCAERFEYAAYFWAFASARITFPYFFWSFIFLVRQKRM